MSLWDWIGPTSLTKRRGWDALPAVPERKSYPYIDDHRAIVVSPLVHGPGLSDRPASDGNSAVYACLQVIATALSEPPLRVYRDQRGDRSELDDTPLGDLLSRPNPHMTLSSLLAYLSNCLHIDGNAYWRKLRAGNPDTGNVVELWPISPSRIKPMTTPGSGEFISYYRYYHRPGVHEDIPVSNIVHFRMGLDDKDHRLGSGPIRRLIREVSSDEQATRYADRLLTNLAIPGLMAEFDKDAPPLPDQAAADELKARIEAAYGGNNAGRVGIGSPGMKLSQLGFSPEQLDMKTLHRVPEERIAAVLGVPAIVAGLGAGLDRSTYSNFAEAREAFTEMKLVPFWRAIGDVLTMSLVPDFASERGVSVAFMVDEVRALQDDQNAKAVRLKTYVDAGILLVDEARAEIGHQPLPAAQPAPIAEQRSRMRLLSLPLSRKALDDLPGAYEDLRDDQEPDWEDALRTFLAAQLVRATRILRAGGDTADALIAEGEATLLGEVLAPLQRRLLEDVHSLVVGELGIAFDLDDAASRQLLAESGTRIVGITNTTREAVRAALIEGQYAGEGIPQLAARLKDLPAFNDARARVVARTELANSTNLSAMASYRASGVVVGIRVLDSDADPLCQAWNGRVLPMAQAASIPMLGHPNCVRALAPIVDAQELTG